MSDVSGRLNLSYLKQQLFANKLVLCALIILLIMIISVILAPVLATQNPYDLKQIDILDSEIPPLWLDNGDSRFLLGTDEQGRDLFSTILYGTRISIIIGLGAVLLQLFLGIVIGLTAGYFGGLYDSFLMRLADIQLSFSTMMIAIVFLALLQAIFGVETYGVLAVPMLILVIGVADWPQYARTIRAITLAEKKKEYVSAVRIMGFSRGRIMFRHILPNSLSSLIVIATIQVANAIITEAGLSFLGLGMPVNKPALGSLISNGFHYIFSGSWWISVIPGVILIALILCINILGDWLRDVLNPKQYNE